MTALPGPDLSLVSAVRAALREVADPDRAPAMRAYMKSDMPFLGVPKPVRTAALRPVWQDHPHSDPGVWEATILALFDDAGYREERYAALALLARLPARPPACGALMPLLEHLVVAGAWWDLVDETSHQVGRALLADPAGARPTIRRWTTSQDRWLRRSSVICQVGAKDRVDLELLDEAITANIADQDFFLRKAIGWALRDVSGQDGRWVRTYVARHPDLSPLSRREALRRLPPL